jgi:hypothetical protein
MLWNFLIYWMCDETQGYINSWVCAVCSDMITATSHMDRKSRQKMGYGKIKGQGFYVCRLSVYTLHITGISHIKWTFYLTTEWTENIVLTWQFTENLGILQTRYKFIIHIVNSCLVILWIESCKSLHVCNSDYEKFFFNTDLRTL